MEEKTYLKWHNKVGYGSGDIAGNVVYAFLSSFVMIYLTNTIGLNSGIVGTLIAVSKLFDGITDIFFGTMIDRTKSKMGKARPWMFYGFFGCAITLYGVFAIPTNILYCKQHCICSTDFAGNKEQQRTSADGFFPFHVFLCYKPCDSVYYCWSR